MIARKQIYTGPDPHFKMASEFSFDPVNSSENSPVRRQTEGHKTWAELRDVVRETRKLISSLASRVPSCFKYRTEDTPHGKITRLYFLAIPPKQRENTLLYVNVPTSPMSITPTLAWCQLLGTFQTALPPGQMSKEEQLLRERKRMGRYGITSYELVENEGKFLFPACNSLFVCTDTDIKVGSGYHTGLSMRTNPHVIAYQIPECHML